MATFTGQPGNNDTFTGTSGADTFVYAVADLDSGDSLNGAGGTDTLQLSGTGTRTAAQLAGLRAIEVVTLLNGGISLTFDGTVATQLGGALTVNGSAGDDTIDYAAVALANRTLTVVAGAGNDVFRGGAGADTFRFDAVDLGGDVVTGGAGVDIVAFLSAGTVTAAALANVTGVERFVLANGTNSLTLNAGNAAGIASGTVQVVGGTGSDTINAAALTGGAKLDVTAGTGVDVILGSAGNDTFRFNAGELANDRVDGAGGQDGITIVGQDMLTAADLARVSNIERITLSAGGGVTLNNTVAGQNASSLAIYGTAGNERIDASAVTLTNRGVLAVLGAGSDVALGGLAPDVFRFNAGELDELDLIVGGGGASPDTLTFLTPVTVTAGDLANVRGMERVTLAQGANRLTLTDALATSAYNQYLTIYGHVGNDVIDGTLVTSATTRLEMLAGGGNDTLTGGAGNDLFRFGVAALDAADNVRGGAGTDQLLLSGTGAVTAAKLAGVRDIESVVLTNGGIVLSLDTAFAQRNGTTLTIYGSDGNDVVDASAHTDYLRQMIFVAGGGDDTLRGHSGKDIFRFAADQLTAGDVVRGGDAGDTVQFTAGGVVTADDLANVTGIGTVVLAAGMDLTLSNAIVAGLLEVTGTSGNDRVDGSRVTNTTGGINVNAGGGDDTFIGTGGDDIMRFGATALTAADRVDAGAGDDDLLMFVGSGAVSLGGNVTGIDRIWMTFQGVAATVTEAFAQANASAMTVEGSYGDDLMDASAVSAAMAFTFTANRGNDTFRGGAGADVFRFVITEFTAADRLNGGGGTDVLRLSNAGTIDFTLANNIAAIERIELDDSAHRVVLSDAMAVSATNQLVTVVGGTGTDVVDTSRMTDSASRVRVELGDGDDVLVDSVASFFGGPWGGQTTGALGAGNDRVEGSLSTFDIDVLEGGAGYDTIALDATGAGDVSYYLPVGLTGFEQVDLVASGGGAGQTLTIYVSDAANLVVSGAAAGNRYVITLGAGGQTAIGNNLNDTLTAGTGVDMLNGQAGNDTLAFAVANLTGADRADGGAGTDTLAFTTGGAVTAAMLAGVRGVEAIRLYSTGTLTLTDAFMAQNTAGLLVTGTNAADTVNASALTGANAITVVAQSGNDTLRGGAGADTFQFMAAGLTAADTVQGGAGAAIDTLQFTNAGSIDAAALAGVSGVERILLANGTNTLVLSAAIAATADAGTLRVVGGSGNDTIDGSAGTAKLDITAGAGDDSVLGGGGDDIFRFALTGFTGADTLNGVAGVDTLVLTGAGTIDFTGDNIRQIERVVLDDNDHNVVLGNSMVGYADGTTVTLVGGAGVDVFDVSRVTVGDNTVVVDLGAGDDVLVDAFPQGGGGPNSGHLSGTLGSGNDTVRSLFSSFDPGALSGGTGIDTIELSAAFGYLQYIMGAGITDFEVLNLVNLNQDPFIVLSANDTAGLTINAVTQGTTYTIALGNGGQTVNGADQGDTLTGGIGADTIRGNGGDDVLDGGGGADVVEGGEGADRIAHRAGAASLDGGLGFDTLVVYDGGIFDLSLADQSIGDATLVTGFERIDGATGTATGGAAVYGTLSGEYIRGTQFDDVIDGKGGNDTLVGAEGADRISYYGTETLVQGYYEGTNYDVAQGDTLVLRAATTVRLFNADQTTADAVNVAGFQNIDGSAITVALSLAGDAYGNVMTGGSGNDGLSGLEGDDTLDGGAGADALYGAAGNDRIWYDGADSTISAGADRDTLLVRGAATINLTAGDQSLNDTASTSGFEDVDASTAAAAVTLRGRNDIQSQLRGGSAADTINAGTAGAYIHGGAGADRTFGANTTDYFTFYSGDVVAGEVISGNGGTDYLYAYGTVDFTGATMSGIEQLEIGPNDPLGGAPFTQDSVVRLTGTQAAAMFAINLYNPYAAISLIIDVASGTTVNLAIPSISAVENDETVTVNGAAGNETIIGPQVRSVLHGGGGDDTLRAAYAWYGGSAIYGDAGNDRIDYNDVPEDVLIDGGADTDTLVAGVNYGFVTVNLGLADQTVGDYATVRNFENADWSGSASYSVRLTGSASANVLTGGSGNDVIDGAGGADRINGWAGDDTIVYRGDAVSIGGSGGTDTLRVLGAAQIGLAGADQSLGDTAVVAGFEHVDGSASTARIEMRGRDDFSSRLTGGSAGDQIVAGHGGALITGGGGADVLIGETGDDGFIINDGDFADYESIDGGIGYDDLFVRASTDFTDGTLTNLERLFLQTPFDPETGGDLDLPVSVTLTGAQAAQFDAIYGNGSVTGSVDTVTINLAPNSSADLGEAFWGSFEDEDRVFVNGAAGGETLVGPQVRAVIHGYSGNDVLRASTYTGEWGDGTQVYGDAGNDRIDYGALSYSATLNGGEGFDTLVANYNVDYAYNGMAIDLGAADQTTGDAKTTTNFEHVDWSASDFGISIFGGANSNAIIASNGYDHIDGRGGRDAVDGGAGVDFIVYDAIDSVTAGGAGDDWLIVNGAANLDLSNVADQGVGDDGLMTSMEHVDARAATVGVTAKGSSASYSYLLGSAHADTLTAGDAAAYLIGGKGADTLAGSALNDTFHLFDGDFAAGESLTGNGGSDLLYVAGGTDLRLGSVTGMTTLAAFGGGYAIDQYGNFAYDIVDVATSTAMTAEQASQFTQIYANRFTYDAADLFTVYLTAGETDLSSTSLYYFQTNDALNVIGSSGNDVYTHLRSYGAGTSVHGGFGADTIHSGDGQWYSNTSIYGDAGADRIDYLRTNAGGITLDGGADADTLVVKDGNGGNLTVDLSQLSDQTSGDGIYVVYFENVDATDFNYILNATGSTGANTLLGGYGTDTLSGGNGNDLLDGGALAADTLTGGTGSDTFRFLTRDGSVDTITDFSSADDTLRFGGAAFDINGAAVDRFVADGNGHASLAGADVIRYISAALNDTTSVSAYLQSNATGTAGEGAFVIGVNSAGRTLVYHTTDASGANGDVTLVANLSTTAANSLVLADFALV